MQQDNTNAPKGAPAPTPAPVEKSADTPTEQYYICKVNCSYGKRGDVAKITDKKGNAVLLTGKLSERQKVMLSPAKSLVVATPPSE